MANNGEYRTVLPIFLEQSSKGHPLTITGDGEQRRDFTHVDDIVDAIDSILSVEGLMLEAEKELRTETEFLKNKKKEESEEFKIKELNL